MLLFVTAACASTSSTSVQSVDHHAAGDSAAGVYRIDQITLASENPEVMVAFYQSVFGVRFRKLPATGTYIYSAQLFGAEFVITPGAAEMPRTASRYQFNIIVPDLESAVQRVVNTGGTLVKAPVRGQSERIATVTDPDGNSMVLVERITPH